MIRVASLLLLLSACGVVDDVGRTQFRVRELPFQVEVEAGDPLARQLPDLEQPVDLSENTELAGAELDDVRTEQIQVAAYTNTLGVRIEQIQFIVAPVSIETRTVFAALADIAANDADWPEPETYEPGIDQLEHFIADQPTPFLVQAAITFDVPEGYRAGSPGLLDIRLRISASALAAR